METLKKKAISVNRQGYNIELKKYNLKKDLEKRMIEEVNLLVEHAEIPKGFFNDIMNSFYSIVEHSMKEKNLMGIKGLQLVNILEIDFSNLYQMSERYQKVKSTTKPNINAFTIYAETADEINKLSICELVINHLKQIKELGHLVYPVNIQRAYNGMLSFDVMNGEIVPNSNWIKSERVIKS